MNQTRSGMDCFCSALILGFIVYGLFGCIFYITEMEKVIHVINGTISVFILFAILCSFLYYSKQSARVGLPIMTIILTFLIWISRKDLMESLTVIARHILLRIHWYYNMDWEIKENVRYIYSRSFRKGIFILTFIIMFLLSIDIIGLIYAKRVFILAVCILTFGMCVGKMPSSLYIFLLLIGLFGLFSMTCKSKNFHIKWRFGKREEIEVICNIQQEEKETLLHGPQKAALFTIGCFLLSLFFGFMMQRQFGKEILSFHKSIQNWANQIEYTILNYDYGKFFRGNYFENRKEGSQGKLNNFKIQYSGKEVLQVTVYEVPKEGMYLRGFVGKDYQGNCWSAVDGQGFSATYVSPEVSRNGKEIIGNLTYDMIRKKTKYFDAAEIKIDYIDAPGRYAYLPYYTRIEDFLKADGDGMVYRLYGQEKENQINSLSTKGFWKYSGKYYENLTVSFEKELEIDEWKRISKLEKKYYNYVCQQYLNVPDTIPALEKNCKESAYTDIWDITEFIYIYLRQRAVYSMDLEPVPYGEDFIEYFLYTQRKGYCIHFATAAVLMYRLLGIPARFVEGYVAWPEDFVDNGDGTYTASIPDSQAHAWTEIYYKGFGFIPIDMTPGNEISGGLNQNRRPPGIYRTEGERLQGEEKKKKEDTMPNREDKQEQELEQKKKDNSNTAFSEKEKETKKKGSKKKGDTVKKIEKNNKDIINRILHFLYFIVPIMLYFIIVIVFLTILNIFYHRRKYRKHQNNLLYGIKDRKRKEIIKISCKFYECLRISGIEKAWYQQYGKNISDREYEKIIEQEFLFLENNEYHKFREMVQKALYCSPQAKDPISDKEIRECMEFLGKVKTYLLQKIPWYKKIFINGMVR